MPPPADMTVEEPASTQVLTPLSTTSLTPAPLRRATYVQVCDLAKPFSIDDVKLREEISKLERLANDEAENETKKPSDPTDSERSSDDQATTEEVATETASATASVTKLRMSGSKENIAENQFQHQSQSSYKKLSPPSNGFNLCL